MCDDVGGVYDAKSGGSPAPSSHFPLEGTWCRHHSFTPSFCWRGTFWCTLLHHDLLLLEGSWWCPCSIMTSCWREAGGTPAPSRPPAGTKMVGWCPQLHHDPFMLEGTWWFPLLHHDPLMLDGSWWCPCSITASFCWREPCGAPAPS
jgi:hypothetical protein